MSVNKEHKEFHTLDLQYRLGNSSRLSGRHPSRRSLLVGSTRANRRGNRSRLLRFASRLFTRRNRSCTTTGKRCI